MARRVKKRPSRCMYCDRTLKGLTGHQKGCRGDLLRRIATFAERNRTVGTHDFNGFGVCKVCKNSQIFLESFPQECKPPRKKTIKKRAVKKSKPRKSKVAPPTYTPPPDLFEFERQV